MVSKVIYLALTLLAAALAAPDNESRIVGGTPTTIEQFPYIVALVYYYPRPAIYVQRCVGSLISSFHVATTAFCFTGADLDLMLVRAGSTQSLTGGILSTIDNVIIHPNYIEKPRTADIAVTRLAWPFGLSDTIKILYLPPQQWYIPDGTRVKIVSWGFKSADGPQLEDLSTINLYKLPLDECQKIYADSDEVVIDDPVICASQTGLVGTCLGDSGAPMVINNVVVGLSSYHATVCGSDDYPDVFTRIDRFTNWIMAVSQSQGRNGTINVPRIAPQH